MSKRVLSETGPGRGVFPQDLDGEEPMSRTRTAGGVLQRRRSEQIAGRPLDPHPLLADCGAPHPGPGRADTGKIGVLRLCVPKFKALRVTPPSGTVAAILEASTYASSSMESSFDE